MILHQAADPFAKAAIASAHPSPQTHPVAPPSNSGGAQSQNPLANQT